MHSASMNPLQTSKEVGYSNIDIAKFVCALLVILIHTAPLESVSDIANFYLVNVVARVAVPLFFAVSGFLFFGKLTYENGKIKKCPENIAKLIRYCKKNAILYLDWSAAYIILIKIPLWYQTGWWGLYVIKDCLASILFVGTHYHLWYLLALIYAVPLLYALLRFFGMKLAGIIASFLWICECLTYSYSWIGVDQIPLVALISSRIPIAFSGLFLAIPLLMAGAAISQHSPDWSLKKRAFMAASAFALCALEASLLFFFVSNSSKYSYLIFTPFLAFSWLCFLSAGKQCDMPKHIPQLLRSMSLTIYCLHPMVIDLLLACGIPNGIALWAAVTFATTGLSAAWALYKHGTKNRF